MKATFTTLAQEQLINTDAEPDDNLHWPGEPEKRIGAARLVRDGPLIRQRGFQLTWRGMLNTLGLLVIFGALLAVFLGWPVATSVRQMLSPIVGTPIEVQFGPGSVPSLPNFRTLIDKDTPESAYARGALA